MRFWRLDRIKATFSGDLYVDPVDIINDPSFDEVLDDVEEIARLHGVE